MPVWHVVVRDHHAGWPFDWNRRHLEQGECNISVVSSHSGNVARVERSANAAELQAAADTEGELTYLRLSLEEIFGGTAPLKS